MNERTAMEADVEEKAEQLVGNIVMLKSTWGLRVMGVIIKSFSADDMRRNEILQAIAYSDEVLRDRAQLVAVSEVADSPVDLVVRPWCAKENQGTLRFDRQRRFNEDLEAAGCSIPFRKQAVHIHTTNGAAAA